MFRWSGRSVTGTRLGIICFSLFALVSMPYEVIQLHTQMDMPTFLLSDVAAASRFELELTFLISRKSFLVGKWVVVVNSCFGCFSSPLEGTAVGRGILTVIFTFVALSEEAAHIKRSVFILYNFLLLTP